MTTNVGFIIVDFCAPYNGYNQWRIRSSIKGRGEHFKNCNTPQNIATGSPIAKKSTVLIFFFFFIMIFFSFAPFPK